MKHNPLPINFFGKEKEILYSIKNTSTFSFFFHFYFLTFLKQNKIQIPNPKTKQHKQSSNSTPTLYFNHHFFKSLQHQQITPKKMNFWSSNNNIAPPVNFTTCLSRVASMVSDRNAK